MELTDADKDKLRNAFGARGSVNGNVMNLIGLDEVRARFPDKWERLRDRVTATTQVILKQFTDPHTDIILPIGDAGFVVLFTRLEKHEALLRASVIKAEILRRFLGDDALDTLDMQVHAMELDSGAMMKGTLDGLLGSALSSDTSEDRAPPEAKPVSSPSPKRTQMARRASMAEMLASSTLTLEALEARFAFSLDSLDFGFQPYLHVGRGVFAVYACRVVRHSAVGDILTGYKVLPRDADADQVAALDQVVLMRARHSLVDMALRKSLAIVGVPVSFETMTNRRAATEYLAALQKIPSDLRAYLVPALFRCPVGGPEGRLAEIINPLKRLSRAVNIRLDSAKQPFAPLKAAGAFSISIGLSDPVGSYTSAPGSIERYASMARKLGLRTFVEGVDTPEQALRCRAAKVDYVAGRMFAVSNQISRSML